MEEPGRLKSMGSLESDTTERLHFRFSLSCIGEGNGNPLQCSCLENPRNGGPWWAAIYGVAQSWTRLKWLSSSSSSMKQKQIHRHREQACSCQEGGMGKRRIGSLRFSRCKPLYIRECLTGGLLHAVSHKFSVPYQVLFWERVELHAALRTEIMRNGIFLDSLQ